MTNTTDTTATPTADLAHLGAEKLSFAAFEEARETGAPPKEEQPSEGADDAPKAAGAAEPQTQDQEPKADEKPGEAGEKKRGGFQKKIDKLTREKRELEARLAALEPKPAAESAGDKPAGQDAAPADKPALPAPAAKPKPEDFETYEEFVEKLADWTMAQREKARVGEEARTLAAQRDKAAADTWLARESAVRETRSDYDEVIAGVNKIDLPDYVRFTIFDSDRGPELAYALAQQPAELERIAKLTPLAAARELGKIEASLPSATSAPEVKPAPAGRPEPSSAPKPLSPLRGAGDVVGLNDPKLPYEDWERRRNEQLAARRR